MKIKDMNAYHNNRNILSMDVSTYVIDAVTEMSRLNYGAVMVTEGKMIAGIVTERDIMKRLVGNKMDPGSTKLEDIMTRDIYMARPDDPVADCMDRMEKGHFRHVPVVGEHGEVVSMISQRDFVTLGWSDLIKRAGENARASISLGQHTPWLIIAGVFLYGLILLSALTN